MELNQSVDVVECYMTYSVSAPKNFETLHGVDETKYWSGL